MGIKEVKGGAVREKGKFAIVISRFNEFVSHMLLRGCIDELARHSVKEDGLTVVWTPGSFEIPLVAKRLAQKGGIDAVICLGAIVRGETPHFEYVANEMAKGIANVSLETGIPIVMGVITADTLEQAMERAGAKSGNKGRDAALVALEMANLLEQI